MRALTIIMRGLALMIIAMLFVPPGIPAQDSGQPSQTDSFSEAELTQMLAPIALYPDSLIAQILMASTYPLEVVEAERWLRQNNKLPDDKLDDAMLGKPWDPSVKSLCHFPDVLFALSDKLDQTRKLGDAFLSQQDDVMDTLQKLRLKAQEQGNLKTTKEEKVIVENNIIRIEPTDPYVVYVPAYDPLYVYGPWWYPAYPPWYWYYPGAYISSGFVAFGPPFFIGFDLFLWPWFDWSGHHIYADYYYDHDRRHDHDYGSHYWEHDPYHRRGVAYRDRTTSQRYGQLTPIPRTSPATRGYPGLSPIPKSGGQHQGLSPMPSSGVQRQTTVTPRSSVRSQRGRTAPEGNNTFQGIGNGNLERRASQRGGVSSQGEGVSRQSKGTGRQSRESNAGSGSRENSRDRGFRR